MAPRPFVRKHLYDALWGALHGEPRLLQVVTGPRQVGKTTIALQISDHWEGPKVYESADQPSIPDAEWIIAHWKRARASAAGAKRETLLILDEVQKISRWSEIVKALADEDRRRKTRLRVMLLGSSALLVQRGLTESLAGRFELHRHSQWSYKECADCFGLSLEDFFVYGGYPGALGLRKDFARWSRFIRDSLVETVLGKDVLLMSPVQKPALLRQAFGMACAHPAEILSYQKMLGQLTDAGNTVTLAHYFHLFSAAYLMASLQRWSGNRLRQRGSIPKIVMRDNGLITAMTPALARDGRVSPSVRGRLVENAVGAALVAAADGDAAEVFYWRDRQEEVDFVLRRGDELLAIEVKSGKEASSVGGLRTFKRRYPKARCMIIGGTVVQDGVEGISLEQFFLEGIR